MNFGIPGAFAYIGPIIELIWIFMIACSAFGLGWIAGGCAQRG